MVLAEANAGGISGLGYSYADVASGHISSEMVAHVVTGRDAMAVPGCWLAMVESIRNLGRPGIASMAISAVDAALWDLKARLLDVPLITLLGPVRKSAPIYGSGGFTSYSRTQLQRQLGDWVASGILRVKMKIGRNPDDDPVRVTSGREPIGREAKLLGEPNGAYSCKQALALANSV